MSTSDHPRPPRERRMTSAALTLLMTLVLLAGSYFAFREVAQRERSNASSVATPEPWPTIPATFTPMPTASPRPTATMPPAPTPIILEKQQISEWAVMQLMVSSAQSMTGDDARILGIPIPNTQEKITVEYRHYPDLSARSGQGLSRRR
ncbi:MAG: hypothetical protein DIU80_015340, partial [Chloroflexota bacterium]